MKRHYTVNTYSLGPRGHWLLCLKVDSTNYCTVLLTKLNNQNFIFPPVKLKQPSPGEGGVIFLALLDRLDPNPYLTRIIPFVLKALSRVGLHSCTQAGFLVFFNLPLLVFLVTP